MAGIRFGEKPLKYEKFAARDAVSAEMETVRELREGNADARQIRLAEKKVSKAKRQYRRTY